MTMIPVVVALIACVVMLLAACGSVSSSRAASSSSSPYVAQLTQDGYTKGIALLTPQGLAPKTRIPANYFIGGAAGYSADCQHEQMIAEFTNIGAQDYLSIGIPNWMVGEPISVNIINGTWLVMTGAKCAVDVTQNGCASAASAG